jgi:hypothetical protein
MSVGVIVVYFKSRRRKIQTMKDWVLFIMNQLSEGYRED